MIQQTRSTRRIVLGIFSIVLGTISLVAFLSITYIAGVGFLGGFYGLILIAVGVGLILPKKENPTGRTDHNLTDKPPGKKRTYPRATALVGGLLAGFVAGIVAYLVAGLAGFIVAFLVGVITGSQATLLSLRARQQQA